MIPITLSSNPKDILDLVRDPKIKCLVVTEEHKIDASYTMGPRVSSEQLEEDTPGNREVSLSL